MTKANHWETIEKLVEGMIEGQKTHLLKCGRKVIPTLTPEDVLQPNDYRELEYHPHFRYEEGTLAGMQSIQMALRALKNEEYGDT